MRTTGMTIFVAEVMKASRAALASSTVKRPLDQLDILALQQIDQRGARDAAQDGVVDLAGDEPPSRSTIQALEEAPSVTWPLSSTNQASLRPFPRAASLASEAGSSITVLMSQRAQRMSGMVLMAMPVGRGRLGRAGDALARQADDGRRHVGRAGTGSRAGARRATPADRRGHRARGCAGWSRASRATRPRRHRLRDAQLGQRAGQALHVPRLVDQPPAPDLAYLVDCIAELEAAILRVDARFACRAGTGR